MRKPGKYNAVKLIVSSLATTAGIILVGTKIYAHIGMLLLSFGSVALALSLDERKKEITSDELTEWVSGKSAAVSFWSAWSAIVILLALDIYRPNILEAWIALGIVMFALAGGLFAGMYYYGKIRKEIGVE